MDRDEEAAKLVADYKRLDYPNKSKVLIVPQVRPELDDAKLVELMIWANRASAIQGLVEWNKQRNQL
jgi:hypothetical protein